MKGLICLKYPPQGSLPEHCGGSNPIPPQGSLTEQSGGSNPIPPQGSLTEQSGGSNPILPQGSLTKQSGGSNPILHMDRCQRQSDLSSTLTLSPIYPPLTPPGRGTVQVIASEAYRSRQSLLPPLPLSLLFSFLPFPVPRIGYKR